MVLPKSRNVNEGFNLRIRKMNLTKLSSFNFLFMSSLLLTQVLFAIL